MHINKNFPSQSLDWINKKDTVTTKYQHNKTKQQLMKIIKVISINNKMA